MISFRDAICAGVRAFARPQLFGTLCAYLRRPSSARRRRSMMTFVARWTAGDVLFKEHATPGPTSKIPARPRVLDHAHVDLRVAAPRHRSSNQSRALVRRNLFSIVGLGRARRRAAPDRDVFFSIKGDSVPPNHLRQAGPVALIVERQEHAAVASIRAVRPRGFHEYRRARRGRRRVAELRRERRLGEAHLVEERRELANARGRPFLVVGSGTALGGGGGGGERGARIEAERRVVRGQGRRTPERPTVARRRAARAAVRAVRAGRPATEVVPVFG